MAQTVYCMRRRLISTLKILSCSFSWWLGVSWTIARAENTLSAVGQQTNANPPSPEPTFDIRALRRNLDALLPKSVPMPGAWTQVRGGADDIDDPRAFAYKYSLIRNGPVLGVSEGGVDITVKARVQLCVRKRVRARFLFITTTPLVEGCTDPQRRMEVQLRIVPVSLPDGTISANLDIGKVTPLDALVLKQPRLGIPLRDITDTATSQLRAFLAAKQDDIRAVVARTSRVPTLGAGIASVEGSAGANPIEPRLIAPPDADIALAFPWRLVCNEPKGKYVEACDQVGKRSGLRAVAPFIDRLFAFHIAGKGQVIVAEADAKLSPEALSGFQANPSFATKAATVVINNRLLVYYSDTVGLAAAVEQRRGMPPGQGARSVASYLEYVKGRDLWAVATLDEGKVKAFASKVAFERRLDSIATSLQSVVLYATKLDLGSIDGEARFEYTANVTLQDVQQLSSALQEGVQQCTCFRFGEPCVDATVIVQPIFGLGVPTLAAFLQLF